MSSFRDLSKHPVALAVAEVMLEGFNKHYRIFSATNRAAKQRFENQDWTGVQQASPERILFYDQRVKEATERLEAEFHASALDDDTWRQTKLHYIGLL